MNMEEISNIPGGTTLEFERIGEENGGFWYARQLMNLMGYETYSSFQKAIGRAISTCSTLEFSIHEHFTPAQREIDGGACRRLQVDTVRLLPNGDERRSA